MNWSEYQEQAANFFSSLGLTTNIEHKVEGVRGSHAVDVYVTGSYSGIVFNWVVECKAWKNNIPKEKVMALAAIVQDVGADRGFLLSEVGFQSGAIRASRTSNVTLTSIADLSFSTEKFAIDTLIGKKSWEIQKAKSGLLTLKKTSEAIEYNSQRIGLVGELCVLEFMLQEALDADYPIGYPTKGIEFLTLEHLSTYADDVIKSATDFENSIKS